MKVKILNFHNFPRLWLGQSSPGGESETSLSLSFRKICWFFYWLSSGFDNLGNFVWAFFWLPVITILWLETRLSLNPPKCSGCSVEQKCIGSMMH